MASTSQIEAGRAFVRLMLKDDMIRELRRTLRSAGDAMKDAGRTMVAVGGAIVAPLTLAVKSAGDLAETQNKFNAVFGESADAVADWADTYRAAIGRSKQETLDSLSAFQGFFSGLGLGTNEAAQFSKQMATLSTDFASFHNLADQEGMERFISALSGSSEVLDRFGVNTKVAALNQKLLAMGFPEVSKGATEMQKVLARMEIIRESMGRQGAIGDAEKTAGSFANQLKALRASIKDMGAEVGATLLPAVTEWISRLRESLTPMLEWVKQNRETVVLIAKVAAGVLAAGAVFYALGTTLGGLATTIKVVQGALMLLIAHPVIAGVAALAVVVYKLTDATAKLSDKQRQALASGDALRKQHQSQFQELQQLADKQSLTSDEMDRAESIVKKLETAYGGLGVRVDRATGSITGMGEAQQKLNAAMAKAAQAEANAALQEAQANLSKLRREMSDTKGLTPGQVATGFFGYLAGNNEGIDDVARDAALALNDRIMAARAQVDAAKYRLDAIKAGEAGSLTGGLSAAASPAAGPMGVGLGVSEEELARRQEQEKRYLDRVRRLRIEAMQDEYAKAIALIKLRYATELRESKAVGVARMALETARDQEIANLEAEHRRKVYEEQEQQQEQRERRVGLTATYSAAAASISGYQPGGPQQQMAAGIKGIERNTAELNRLQEQFLAGWRVA